MEIIETSTADVGPGYQTKTASPMQRVYDEFYGHYPNAHAGAVVIDNGVEKIAMNSTAYVALFNHPKVQEKVREMLPVYGVGAGSRYNMGHVRVVRELEERLADLAAVEEAVLFCSGYNLNLGIDSPAFGDSPYFIADSKNHPSILSGIRLSAARNQGGNWGGNCSRYISNDLDNLESFLKMHMDKPNKWILSVGTYGSFGTSINLPGVLAMAAKYNARVYLDDVHFFWVYGPNQLGLTDQYGEKVDILMGSFKAFGMPGAFALGNKDVVSKLRFSEPYIFSIGLLPILSVATLAAIDVIYSDEGRTMVENLWKNVRKLRNGLESEGFKPLAEEKTQLVCFKIEGEDKAIDFVRTINSKGLFVQPYFHPAVPRGVGHVRLTPLSSHTDEHINKTVEIMVDAAKKVGVFQFR